MGIRKFPYGYAPIVDVKTFEAVQKLKGTQFAKHTKARSLAGRTEYSETMKLPVSTTYIPSKAVYEKEKELKLALQAENADGIAIRKLILELASEKYNCIL